MKAERPEADQLPGFEVHLTNFEGPFDLLLQLISKHKMDVTEVALSRVTGEFISHLKAMGDQLDLTQTSSFLLVAATLLDLKAARLLPGGEVDDEEDLAVLEARDLLFARLLQYRAYKEISAWMAQEMTEQGLSFARPGGLEEEFKEILPELVLKLSAAEFADLAGVAMTPRPVPVVNLDHLHASTVSVAEQAQIVMTQLRTHGKRTFRALVAGVERLQVVARFLALLELYKEGVIHFEQITPLGELTVRWTGSSHGEIEIHSDYDEEPSPDSGAADE